MRLRGTEAATLRVLGIDPGSQRTGFGVLDAVGTRLTYVASGVIRTQTGEFADRLCEIFRCVQTIVAQYRPHEIAIERVFVNRNPDSALKLGQARGGVRERGRREWQLYGWPASGKPFALLSLLVHRGDRLFLSPLRTDGEGGIFRALFNRAGVGWRFALVFRSGPGVEYSLSAEE